MERWTGRFFSETKMASPKSRPRPQKMRPIDKSLWPSMPQKLTEERSGNFRLASPPTSEDCAKAELEKAKTLRKMAVDNKERCIASTGFDSRRTVACHVDIEFPPGDAKKACSGSPSSKFVTGSPPLHQVAGVGRLNCSTNDFLLWQRIAHVRKTDGHNFADQNRNPRKRASTSDRSA